MAKPKYDWHPILEMDLDDGTHTCYSTENKQWRVFTTQISDGTWDVELQRIGTMTFTTQANCKTLTSARRWVARYLYF